MPVSTPELGRGKSHSTDMIARFAENLFMRMACLLTPPVCMACQCTFAPRGTGHSLCTACTAAAFTPQARCVQCGLRIGPRLQAFGWTRCRHCRAQPTATRTWVAADYLPPFDSLPKALKFQGQQALAKDMGAALARNYLLASEREQTRCNTNLQPSGTGNHETAMEPIPTPPDCFIPVPVSPGRLRERGYNQALLIARSLGQHLAVQIKPAALLKLQDTGRQADLSASQRQDNLAGAFTCQTDVYGLHVGLVDDVMTTGATLAACEQTLMDAGTAQVSRWVAFRTPEKPESLET